MRWRGRRQSGNIDDRRSSGGFSQSGFRIPMGGGGGRRGGGLGIWGLLIILAIGWMLGVNPLTLLSGLDGGSVITGGGAPSGGTGGTSGTPSDERGQFVATVLAETEDTWTRIFQEGGSNYPAPVMVLFRGQVQSACGFASAATGPFYCPGDRRVYIDLSFFDELDRRFGAPGDFAQAYVIAHEVGHHVQNVLGILGRVNAQRSRMSEADSNALSVRTELQADCFAGIFAHEAEKNGILEVGDIDEALNAAAQIGDDAIQQRTRGYVVPESFNHGSSAQRGRWFKLGYQQGRLDACDTFSASQL